MSEGETLDDGETEAEAVSEGDAVREGDEVGDCAHTTQVHATYRAPRPSSAAAPQRRRHALPACKHSELAPKKYTHAPATRCWR